jgi:hypothetical protein
MDKLLNMLIPAAIILWCRHQNPVLVATVVKHSHTVLIKVKFVKTNEIKTLPVLLSNHWITIHHILAILLIMGFL